LLLLPMLAVAGTAFWWIETRTIVPKVPFSKAISQTISNVLSTNGKVEPSEYVQVRVETAGLVKQVLVHEGDNVRQGQTLAELTEPGLQQELDAATAREAQARAELATLQGGGRSGEVAEIEGDLNRLKSDREAARRNLESLGRLKEKQAATAYEVDQAQQALQGFEVQIQSLEHRRAELVGKGDLAAAQARVREAEANVQLARNRIQQDLIRAPMAGTVYDLPARAGSYLNIGDAVASIGKLNPVRVRVYVDEPELGRVAEGEKVRITWDALPGRDWNGTVEKRPVQIIALGTRQVGEVLCTIDNPLRELVPGTNVNAFILTQEVENALTVSRAAVRRENGAIGVYVLQPDGTVRWQPVRTGASDALRVQVLSGLRFGDAVAEANEQALKNGLKVSPVFL
jgi:HlyD family secretion protein